MYKKEVTIKVRQYLPNSYYISIYISKLSKKYTVTDFIVRYEYKHCITLYYSKV